MNMSTSRKQLLATRPHASSATNSDNATCGARAPEQPVLMANSILRGARFAILWLAAMLAPMPSALAQTLMWQVEGSGERDNLGRVMASIDDLDGDGLPDVILGATQNQSPDGPGFVVVLSGGTGQVIWSFTGQTSGDKFGYSVANAGDVDNDGTSDIIVGARGIPATSPYNDLDGYVQVFSGATGAVLHMWTGSDAERLGNSVAGVGDVDLDGYDDVIVGAYFAEPGGLFWAGRATVFSGSTGNALFVFNGTQEGEFLGRYVAGPGDVNADGVPDFLVAAPGFGIEQEGRAIVFSGIDGSVLHTFSGIPFSNTHGLGSAVAGAGDVNQDGYADVIVGAHATDYHRGAALVFSGQDGSVLHRFLGSVPGGFFGLTVASAGDVDSDGVPDLLVGGYATYVAGNDDAGLARVFSGSSGAPLFEFLGSTMDGGLGVALAGLGDLDGDGFADLAIASAWGPGPNGLERSGLVQVYSSPEPGPPADPNLSTITADPTDTAFLGTSTITVTPRDSFGLNLGPGHVVHLQASSGSLLGSVVDEGDGTYTQGLQGDVDSIPSVVSATVNGPAISNTVSVTSSSARSIAVAGMDLAIAGSIGGSFLDTQAAGFGPERITEITSNGNPSLRYSFLEHKWTIDVPGGSDSLFFVKAVSRHTLENENFDFAHSLDDISYSPMLTVGEGSNGYSYNTFALPAGTSGVVYVRLMDTDRTPGNGTRNSIWIDHMGIAEIGPPQPGISVNPTFGLVTTEEGGTDSFTVVLDTQPSAPVMLDVSTSDASEGLVSSGAQGPATTVTLTFDGTNWNQPQTVTATGQDDAVIDGDVGYALVTAAATSADLDYDSLDAADVSATNLDDEVAPGISVDSITPDSMNVGTSISVTITGSGFVAGASLTLENGQGPALNVSNLSVTSSTQITATLTAGNGGPKGTRVWDVRVTNPDNSTDVLVTGFSVIK